LEVGIRSEKRHSPHLTSNLPHLTSQSVGERSYRVEGFLEGELDW